VIVAVWLITGCEDDLDSVCVDEPFDRYEWLADIRADLKTTEISSSITQYRYNEQCVYLVNPGDYPDSMTQVYNMEGEVICQFGGIAGSNTCPDFYEKATDAKIIFEQ